MNVIKRMVDESLSDCNFEVVLCLCFSMSNFAPLGTLRTSVLPSLPKSATLIYV